METHVYRMIKNIDGKQVFFLNKMIDSYKPDTVQGKT